MKLKNLQGLTCSAFAFFLAISFISGCKKSSDGSSSAGLSASISGASFQSFTTAATDDKSFDFIQVTGYGVIGGDTAIFVVSFPDTAKVNQVQTVDKSDISIDYHPKQNINTLYSGSFLYGTNLALTVTSIDVSAHKVAGTFSGILPLVNGSSPVDSVIITNGRFNTSYTVN